MTVCPYIAPYKTDTLFYLSQDVLSSNARADHLNERVVFLEAGLGRARDAAQIAGKYLPFTTFRRLIAHTRLTFLFLQSERAFEATRIEQAVAWEDDLRRLVAEAKEATEQQSNAVLRSSEQNLLEKTRAVALLEKQAVRAFPNHHIRSASLIAHTRLTLSC